MTIDPAMISEVSTVITKEHDTIGARLLSRVKESLNIPGLEIKSYEVTNESWNKSETIKLQLNEKQTLVIQIKTA